VLIDGQAIITFNDILGSLIEDFCTSGGEFNLLGSLDKLEDDFILDLLIIREGDKSIKVMNLEPLKRSLIFRNFPDEEFETSIDLLLQTLEMINIQVSLVDVVLDSISNSWSHLVNDVLIRQSIKINLPHLSGDNLSTSAAFTLHDSLKSKSKDNDLIINGNKYNQIWDVLGLFELFDFLIFDDELNLFVLPKSFSTKHVINEWHLLSALKELTLCQGGVASREINDVNVPLESLLEGVLIISILDVILDQFTRLDVIVELCEDSFATSNLRD
jgi:hypothetical protein